MKTALIVLCLAIAGCASNRTITQGMPLHVALVPHDCQNRQILLQWLEDQARQGQLRGETHSDYVRNRMEIRKKIWDIRYHCQSV